MSSAVSPQRVDLNPGSVIQSANNEYVVDRQLGEGGFGVVCKVHDHQHVYALKITKMWEFMPNERLEYAKRFRQEFDCSSSLNSRYIVRSYDFASFKGNPFMTMDFCQQGTLKDRFKEAGNLREVDRIAAGILQGLSDLHQDGIIHRDIKPENILFDDDDLPRLADFGISASIKKRHTQANIMGHAKAVFATCVYSPPEQMDPSRAIKVMGATNDVYAFGATMYEWLSGGYFPFGSFDNFMNDMEGYNELRKTNEWNRELLTSRLTDRKWYNIIDRCLRYDPSERFQNCEEIMQLIGYTGEPDRARQVSVQRDSIWTLKVTVGEEVGRIYNLTNLSRALNRQDLKMGWLDPQNPFTNDLPLAEEFSQFISRYHATFEHDPIHNYWYIRDGQELTGEEGRSYWKPSTNGVLVNSAFIDGSPHRLQPGDIIMIGDTSLKVEVRNPD